jgi:FAD synthase
MSWSAISGIRTAYDTDEIDQAAEILQRPPSTAPQPVTGNALGLAAMNANGAAISGCCGRPAARQ